MEVNQYVYMNKDITHCAFNIIKLLQIILVRINSDSSNKYEYCQIRIAWQLHGKIKSSILAVCSQSILKKRKFQSLVHGEESNK